MVNAHSPLEVSRTKWRLRVGYTFFSKLTSQLQGFRYLLLSWPQAEAWLYGLLSRLQGGQTLELVRPGGRVLGLRRGRRTGMWPPFHPSLLPAYFDWSRSRDPLLFLHTTELVLGSSQLPAATLRVEPDDLQISESTRSQPGPPVVQRENGPLY